MFSNVRKKLFDINDFMAPVMAVIIANMAINLGCGLLGSVLGLRLEGAGINTSVSGWVLSFYYLGMAISSMNAYKIIIRVGHIRAFAVFATVASSASLVHGFIIEPFFWGGLRFIEGYCVAGVLICLESWLNAKTSNKTRGLTMSLYMVSSYLGVAAGQYAITIPDGSGFNIYVLTSIFFSISLIPLAMTRITSPEIASSENISIIKLYKKAPVGVLGCVVSGLITSSFYSVTPIYTSLVNMDIKQASIFMSVCTMGGMFCQIPIGKVSDTMDRRLVLFASSIAMALIALVMVFASGKAALFVMFFYGCFTFAFYPVSVSHINDKLTEKELVSASGAMSLAYGIGAISGPVVVTFLMSNISALAFFVYTIVIASMFTFFTFNDLHKKPDVDYENQTPTEPISALNVSNVVETSDEFQGL
jgi:MFS family permease